MADVSIDDSLTPAQIARIMGDDWLADLLEGKRPRPPFSLLVLEQLMAVAGRRREWGECAWTAPDLFAPTPRVYVPAE